MASRKKKDYDKILSMTECGLCKEELRDPRRIDCGHIYCLKCLEEHFCEKNGRHSTCPSCSKPLKPPEGLVENYDVAVEMVLLIQSLKNVASKAQISKGHDDEKGDDDYAYADVDDENDIKPPPIRPKPVFTEDLCDIHGRKLISVCLDCDEELICSKCTVHQSHNRKDVTEHCKELENQLKKLSSDLSRRQDDDSKEELDLQEMIEKQVKEKDTIKEEIEDIAEEMYTKIHWKQEEMLKPIETKVNEYVRQLSERKEHIKDRISEFNAITNKIGTLPNDNTTTFCRRAKQLVKHATFALRLKAKALPKYQTISFRQNKSAIDDLEAMKLGDIHIEEVYLTKDDDYISSDFVYEEEMEDRHYRNVKPEPPPLPPKPKKRIPPPAESYIQAEYSEIPYDLAGGDSSSSCEVYDDTVNVKCYSNIGGKNEAGEKPVKVKIPEEKPPVSPFSGTFRKSTSIAVNNNAFPLKVCHRVFLPFRPTGFTLVDSLDRSYYAFVTDQKDAKLFAQNGDTVTVIKDLVHPFDIASRRKDEHFYLYITERGKKTGDGSVRMYSDAGVFIKVLVSRLKEPRGIAVSQTGQIYVCDEWERCISVFCPDTGKKKRVISSSDKSPLFHLPLYVMVSVTGKILVSDVGTRQLKLHDETRKYTDSFKPDEGEEELYTSFSPGMCFEDSSSNYYVVDQETNCLYMLRGGRYEKLDLPSKISGHHGIPTAIVIQNDAFVVF